MAPPTPSMDSLRESRAGKLKPITRRQKGGAQKESITVVMLITALQYATVWKVLAGTHADPRAFSQLVKKAAILHGYLLTDAHSPHLIKLQVPAAGKPVLWETLCNRRHTFQGIADSPPHQNDQDHPCQCVGCTARSLHALIVNVSPWVQCTAAMPVVYVAVT